MPIKRLGISPENVIYVGDSGVDMQAANSAGAYAVGALGVTERKKN